MGEMEKMGEMGEMAAGMHVECTDTSGSIWHVGMRRNGGKTVNIGSK